MKATGPIGAIYTEYDAQGDLELGKKLARKLRESNTSLVVAVGLKAALAAKVEIVDVPIVYMMILDPLKHELTAANMTGTLLEVPVDRQLKLNRYPAGDARCMRRRLLNLAFALCLLVSAAATTLWVRSYYRRDRWTYTTWSDREVSTGRMLTLKSVKGILALGYYSSELSLARAHDGGRAGFDHQSSNVSPWTRLLPFEDSGM